MIDEQSVAERVRRVIAAQYLAGPIGVKDTDRLTEDYGADSFDIVCLAMDLEEEFGVQIPDDALAPISKMTVAQLIDDVSGRASQSGRTTNG